MLKKPRLKYVPVDSIIVGERFRKDYQDLDVLIESIEEKGILQPLTIDEDGNLQAGGRRYAAAVALNLTEVPALIRANAGPVDLREVELIENIHRANFTWQEHARAIHAIDNLYKSSQVSWTMRKTGAIIKASLGTVALYIQVSKALEKYPDIANCKSFEEARKYLKVKEEEGITKALRKHQETRLSKESVENANIAATIKRASDNYIISDIFEGLDSMRTGGKVHFIECDPPYGISLGDVKSNQKDSTLVQATEYIEFINKLIPELYRVAYKDSWMIFWFGPTWHTEVLSSLKAAGWTVDDIPALWVKPIGQTRHPECNLSRCYEPFFVCRKGRPTINKQGTPNVFKFLSSIDNKYHHTQRPKGLINAILDTFLYGDEHVFVPFLGSGVTLRCCYEKGFSCHGFDCSSEYKDKFLLEVEKDLLAAVDQPDE